MWHFNLKGKALIFIKVMINDIFIYSHSKINCDYMGLLG